MSLHSFSWWSAGLPGQDSEHTRAPGQQRPTLPREACSEHGRHTGSAHSPYLPPSHHSSLCTPAQAAGSPQPHPDSDPGTRIFPDSDPGKRIFSEMGVWILNAAGVACLHVTQHHYRVEGRNLKQNCRLLNRPVLPGIPRKAPVVPSGKARDLGNAETVIRKLSQKTRAGT